MEARNMSVQVRAVFENGVFRPLQAVRLAERQEVTVTIDGHDADNAVDRAHFALSPDHWQAFCDALDAPPKEIPALRKLLTEASVLDGEGDPTSDASSA
jgi:predicted DNA-binding antitoxin AbrB/MazE fold protein